MAKAKPKRGKAKKAAPKPTLAPKPPTDRGAKRERVIRLVRDEGYTAKDAAEAVGVPVRTGQWWVKQARLKDKWTTKGRGSSRRRHVQVDAEDLSSGNRKMLRGAVDRMLKFLDSEDAAKSPRDARAAAQTIATLVDTVPNILGMGAMLDDGDSANAEERAAARVLHAIGVPVDEP